MSSTQRIRKFIPKEHWEYDNIHKVLRQKVTKTYLDTLDLQKGMHVEYATHWGLCLGYYLEHDSKYVAILNIAPSITLFKNKKNGVMIEPKLDEVPYGQTRYVEEYLLASKKGFGDLFYFGILKDKFIPCK